jgi:hypothetical protein
MNNEKKIYILKRLSLFGFESINLESQIHEEKYS